MAGSKGNQPAEVKVGDLLDVLTNYQTRDTVTAKVIADLGERVKIVDTGYKFETVAWVEQVNAWANKPYNVNFLG